MDLPIFCVIDTRPVKVVASGDGEIDVLAWDMVAGDFVRRMELLDRVIMQDDWVVELTESEFDVHVERLRARSSGHRRAG